MAAIGTILRQARQESGLSLDDLATWSRLPADRLRAAEEGCQRLSAEDVDRVARVFGLRVEDLLTGEAGRAPMTVLLRGETGLAQDMRAVLTTEIDEGLGEFQRVVRDVADLENALHIERAKLPRIDASRCPSTMHPGEHRARRVRESLGLGPAIAIPSMSKLAEALGVCIVWVTHAQVDKEVDGACTMAPRPAILVNIPEAGNLYPWRVRATIAHELGHLLFDLTPGTPVAVSLDRKRQPAHLDEVEQNARAFAACLLAPTEGVRAIVGGLDPSSELAIEFVGKSFGVGRTLAINRLQKVFSLTDDTRMRMTQRSGRAYAGNFAEDQPPEMVGFRGEPLFGLVRRALDQDVVSASRARRVLGLSPFDPLPFDELSDPSLQQPILGKPHELVRKAAAYLAEQQRAAVPGPPALIDGEWHIPLTESGFGPGELRPAGTLILDGRGEVLRLIEVADEAAR
jgi:Zn-dependent peptidase ImmA (M78 family)/transcriptional regulator with XRE-family HTH domain